MYSRVYYIYSPRCVLGYTIYSPGCILGCILYLIAFAFKVFFLGSFAIYSGLSDYIFPPPASLPHILRNKICDNKIHFLSKINIDFFLQCISCNSSRNLHNIGPTLLQNYVKYILIHVAGLYNLYKPPHMFIKVHLAAHIAHPYSTSTLQLLMFTDLAIIKVPQVFLLINVLQSTCLPYNKSLLYIFFECVIGFCC